jgi:membrane protease YdiL (CAAX protease family)
MRLKYCNNCKQNVNPEGHGVDWLIAAILLLAVIIPGVVYITYCFTLKKRRVDPTCPICNGTDFSPKQTQDVLEDEGEGGDTETPEEDTTSFSERTRYHTVLAAFGIGFGTIILVGLWTGIFGGIYYGITGDVPPQVEMMLSNVSLIAGTGSIMWLYFRYSDKTPNFLDIKIPSTKAVGIGALGTVVLLIAATGLEQVFRLFDITAAEHQIYELATAESGGISPEFLLLMIPIAILVIGPTEELIYRGVIQKSLYSKFSKSHAVVLTSLIFALVHFPAYLTSTAANATITVTTVFMLSLVLGKIYAHTENIVIPSLSHGLYNAVLFGLLYIEVAGMA